MKGKREREKDEMIDNAPPPDVLLVSFKKLRTESSGGRLYSTRESDQ
jgi:hypothetical protein